MNSMDNTAYKYTKKCGRQLYAFSKYTTE